LQAPPWPGAKFHCWDFWMPGHAERDHQRCV